MNRTISAQSTALDSTCVPLDGALLHSWPLPLDEDGDKLTRGTALVVAGSAVTPGAALLAGESALRMGAGRLQMVTSPEVATALATAVPEALVAALDPTRLGDDTPGSVRALAAQADALLVGPGMGDVDECASLLEAVIPVLGERTVVVLDALGLTVLARMDQATRRLLRGRLVLTPNCKEADHLTSELSDKTTDAMSDDQSPAEVLSALAERTGGVVTSFGLAVAPGGRAWCCDGTPGLGTSSSGDVLAGLVVGAAARCNDSAQAACWATYVHHRAGARLAERTGPVSFLARDLSAEAAQTMRELDRPPQ